MRNAMIVKQIKILSRGPHSGSLLRSLRRYSATSLFGKSGHPSGGSQRPNLHDRRHSLEQSAEPSADRAGRCWDRGGHHHLEDLEEGGEPDVLESDLGILNNVVLSFT
jgi:hypothetical protein